MTRRPGPSAAATPEPATTAGTGPTQVPVTIEGAGGVFRFLFRDTPKSQVAIVLVLNGIGGLFEAALLILLVQVTNRATGGSISGTKSTSLLSSLFGHFTVVEGVGVGALFALLSIGFQLTANRRMAGIAAAKMDLERERIVDAFFRSSVSKQAVLPANTVPDLAANTTAKLGDAVFQNGQAASAWVNLVVLVAAAFAASPVTALAMAVVAGLAGLGFVPLSRRITSQARRWIIKTRGYNEFLSIYTRMFLEIRVFDVSREVRDLTLGTSRDVTDSWRRGRALQSASPIVFRNLVLLLGFVCIGSVAVFAPSAVGGVAVTALLLVRGLAYLQSILINRQAVKASATNGELIDATMLELPRDQAVWGESPLGELRSIELHGAAYSYVRDRGTFADVDLTVERGQFVAILGPSGGGKTTLLKLLMRTVEPTSGMLSANDRPITTYARHDWYSTVGYLSQEVRLFPGTIAENIRFFREADDAAVHEAARGAALDLTSSIFPQGLDSPVAQDGHNLSGGQRQRIGLARCLLTKPQMLVLDEPTSALDETAEAAIMETIAQLAPHMITVMVTHRASTLAYTDIQYQLDRGRLTALDLSTAAGRADALEVS